MRQWLAFLLVGCGVVGLLLSLGRVATVSSDSWTTSGEGPPSLAVEREPAPPGPRNSLSVRRNKEWHRLRAGPVGSSGGSLESFVSSAAVTVTNMDPPGDSLGPPGNLGEDLGPGKAAGEAKLAAQRNRVEYGLFEEISTPPSRFNQTRGFVTASS